MSLSTNYIDCVSLNRCRTFGITHLASLDSSFPAGCARQIYVIYSRLSAFYLSCLTMASQRNVEVNLLTS
jgi:hypothetical protein